MISSMIEEAIKKLSQCSRRNASPTEKCVVPRNVFLKYYQYANAPHGVVSNVGGKTRKTSDQTEASTTDFSDGSEKFAASTDNSDTDAPMGKFISAVNLYSNSKSKPQKRGLKSPPGIATPPGLELTPPQSDCQRQRLNASAAVFVPSFGTPAPPMDAGQDKSQQLRSSVRVLKEVLAGWENGLDGQQDQNDLSGLQNAISKLTPQEAAMVTNFLDSKAMRSTQAGSMQDVASKPTAPVMNLGWPGNPGQWNPAEGVRRKFTPFQGGRLSTPIGAAKQPPKPRKPLLLPIDDGVESFSTHLRDLAQCDSTCVLMVRRINHLEGDAIAMLETYFAKFGTIEKVMSSPTRLPKKGSGSGRPATVGFILMSKAEEVQAALIQSEHIVQGVTLVACPFKSHAI